MASTTSMKTPVQGSGQQQQQQQQQAVIGVPPTADWPTWWMSQTMTRTLQHYAELEQIGEGTYGQVYRAVSTDTGEMVALKKMRLLHGGYWGMPLQLIREIKILKRLRHPNLLSMIEVVTSKGVEHLDPGDPPAKSSGGLQNAIEKEKQDRVADTRESYKGNLFLVLEYMQHDLTGLMDIAYPFTQVQIKCIFRQLLAALAYLHANKYVHRDIKSSNILLDTHFRLKLADFGLARCMDGPVMPQQDSIGSIAASASAPVDLTNKVITLWYRPPEILVGAVQYGTAVDVWSAGCILAELLLNGKPLFAGKTELEQMNLILELLGTPSNDTWQFLDSIKKQTVSSSSSNNASSSTAQAVANAAAALKSLQVTDERYRKVSKLRDKYTRKIQPDSALTLLEKLLEWDPRKRLTAQHALEARYFWSHPAPPDNPAELGAIQVGEFGHFHEFQTKKKRKEAKVEAEAAKEDAMRRGATEEEAAMMFDQVYRKIMKKVAEEGFTNEESGASKEQALKVKRDDEERFDEPRDKDRTGAGASSTEIKPDSSRDDRRPQDAVRQRVREDRLEDPSRRDDPSQDRKRRQHHERSRPSHRDAGGVDREGGGRSSSAGGNDAIVAGDLEPDRNKRQRIEVVHVDENSDRKRGRSDDERRTDRGDKSHSNDPDRDHATLDDRDEHGRRAHHKSASSRHKDKDREKDRRRRDREHRKSRNDRDRRRDGTERGRGVSVDDLGISTGDQGAPRDRSEPKRELAYVDIKGDEPIERRRENPDPRSANRVRREDSSDRRKAEDSSDRAKADDTIGRHSEPPREDKKRGADATLAFDDKKIEVKYDSRDPKLNANVTTMNEDKIHVDQSGPRISKDEKNQEEKNNEEKNMQQNSGSQQKESDLVGPSISNGSRQQVPRSEREEHNSREQDRNHDRDQGSKRPDDRARKDREREHSRDRARNEHEGRGSLIRGENRRNARNGGERGGRDREEKSGRDRDQGSDTNDGKDRDRYGHENRRDERSRGLGPRDGPDAEELRRRERDRAEGVSDRHDRNRNPDSRRAEGGLGPSDRRDRERGPLDDVDDRRRRRSNADPGDRTRSKRRDRDERSPERGKDTDRDRTAGDRKSSSSRDRERGHRRSRSRDRDRRDRERSSSNRERHDQDRSRDRDRLYDPHAHDIPDRGAHDPVYRDRYRDDLMPPPQYGPPPHIQGRGPPPPQMRGGPSFPPEAPGYYGRAPGEDFYAGPHRNDGRDRGRAWQFALDGPFRDGPPPPSREGAPPRRDGGPPLPRDGHPASRDGRPHRQRDHDRR